MKFIAWVDASTECEVSVQKTTVQKNMLAHRGASSCCVDIEPVMDIEGGIKVKKKKIKTTSKIIMKAILTDKLLVILYSFYK